MQAAHDIQIPLDLKPFVSEIWYAEEDEPIDHSFYADGCTGIIFQEGDPDFVFGQTLDPIVLRVKPGSRMMGLIFQPHVMPSIFDLHAKELTDRCVDLSLLSSAGCKAAGYQDWRERVWDADSAREGFGFLFSYLRQLINKRGLPVDAAMRYATDRIFSTNGKADLKELHVTVNLTERTFERRFQEYVGMSPRMFSCVAQFQASMRMLRGGGFLLLSDIAYANGYADQSHFIRWFKKFTGVTPLEFARDRDCRNPSIL